MLEKCIDDATKQLLSSQSLDSFAMVLESDNTTRSLLIEEKDSALRYETLLEMLRFEAAEESIAAVALLSNVTIPENFSPPVSSGIRIHIEEKAFKAENRLSARLLYVPYQLYRTKDDPSIQIQLHDPIPVGLACEIFI